MPLSEGIHKCGVSKSNGVVNKVRLLGLRAGKLVRFFILLISHIYRQYKIKMDPVGYARSLGVKVGENCRFYAMTPGMFGTEPWLITIGNNVHVTAECQLITHDGGTLIVRKEVPDLELTAPITIGNNVYIGLRTIILPGVSIGDRCIIAAGSVVSKSIPSNSVAAGVPARVLKTTDQYLEKAKSKSLHFGHLSANEKEIQLKRHFGV
jgi:acetyltransferase-like isoleucine patch superfamily enzyme